MNTSSLPRQPAVSQRTAVSRGELWFGLLGGAVAWLAHLLLAYAIAEFGCVSDLGKQAFLGISVVAWLPLAATALTVLAAGVAVFVAYRCCRLASRDEGESAAPGPWLDAARAGLLTSGLFVFAILFESIPIFYYLRSC